MRSHIFREHAIYKVTGGLFHKANEALKLKDYNKVIEIGSKQYAYNVSALTVYYDWPKSDSYDLIGPLHSIAIAHMPINIRASNVVAELNNLSKYYENKLSGVVYDPMRIKV